MVSGTHVYNSHFFLLVAMAEFPDHPELAEAEAHYNMDLWFRGEVPEC